MLMTMAKGRSDRMCVMDLMGVIDTPGDLRRPEGIFWAGRNA